MAGRGGRTRRATRTFFSFLFSARTAGISRCRWPEPTWPWTHLANGPPLGLALLQERSCTTVATFCRASTSFRMTSSPRARCPTRLPAVLPPVSLRIPGGPRAWGAGNAAAEGPIGRRSVLPLRQQSGLRAGEPFVSVFLPRRCVARTSREEAWLDRAAFSPSACRADRHRGPHGLGVPGPEPERHLVIAVRARDPHGLDVPAPGLQRHHVAPARSVLGSGGAQHLLGARPWRGRPALAGWGAGRGWGWGRSWRW